MPIVSTDIVYRNSGGAANADENLSLGGAISSAVVDSQLFDNVASSEASAGDTEYRCVYARNSHATLTLESAVAWINLNTTGNHISIGLGTSAVNGTEQTVANESTAPAGVTFSQPATKGAGLAIGNIPAGQHKAIWIRRVVPAAAPGASLTWDVRVEGDTAP